MTAAMTMTTRTPPRRRVRRVCAGAALAALIGVLPALQAQPVDDPARCVSFVLETTSNCLLNNGQQVQVKNSHPNRTVRVWLDRFQAGIGTGDRSRSELRPGADAEPLGCSRSAAGVQEWRVVRAVFVD
jgi:ferric-dicitrate binding protein FerR (iron transport regulator)